MWFQLDLVDKLRQGTWEADCAEMTLTQNDAAAPARFVGQGYLRQAEDGAIAYKVYPSEVTGYSDPMIELVSLPVPGTLIESSRYYRLEARTHDGFHWRVDRTIPSIGGSWSEAGPCYIVDGTAHEINFSSPLSVSVDKHHLTMVFFGDAEIPCNAVTETQEFVAGTHRQTSSRLNVARFSTSFGDFCIFKRDGTVIAEIVAEQPFPPHFEVRIVEALGFVLAKPLYWNAIRSVEDDTETVRVRGKSVALDALLPPPVPREADMNPTSGVWHLFDKYLALVCTHGGRGFHPCSRHLFSVLEASAGTISAQGLALGVAVEGIVKAMFFDVGAMPKTLKPIVKRLRAYFRSWPVFRNKTIKEGLYARVETMLGRILDVSTKSKLYALAKECVVRADHVKAWDALRNTAAHGVTPGSDDLQMLVDLCNQVTVLMYRLIFRAAGYEGWYQDYSTRGWPPKRYRGRPVTEQEIAVAAYFLWLRSGRRHGHDRDDWYAGKEQLEQEWA